LTILHTLQIATIKCATNYSHAQVRSTFLFSAVWLLMEKHLVMKWVFVILIYEIL